MNRTCAALGFITALVLASSSEAQEIQLSGPLRAAPVGRRLWRERRWEIAAALGLRLSDESAPGASLLSEVRYYPLDRVGLGLAAAHTLPLGDASSGSWALLAAPELAVQPLAGRLSWFEYLPYDVHLLAAPAWLWRSDGDRDRRELATSLGVGVRVFWASSFSTSLAYRALRSSPVAHVVSLSISGWPSERRWSDE